MSNSTTVVAEVPTSTTFVDLPLGAQERIRHYQAAAQAGNTSRAYGAQLRLFRGRVPWPQAGLKPSGLPKIRVRALYTKSSPPRKSAMRQPADGGGCQRHNPSNALPDTLV
jgi:hypothetical protein